MRHRRRGRKLDPPPQVVSDFQRQELKRAQRDAQERREAAEKATAGGLRNARYLRWAAERNHLAERLRVALTR